jgi:hypothetical protein
MTLREIDRQNKHWASFPPPALALARIGWALGIEPPRLQVDDAGPVTSEAELRALAASLGVTGGR